MTRRHDSEVDPLRHPDHRRPVTRREFLGQGFISGAAFVAGPSLLGLFGRTPDALAQAATCGVGVGGGTRLPALIFDLAGGASIAGSNVLVGRNTQLDPLDPDGYSRLGLPPGMTPADPALIDTSAGLAFHSTSALLRGIQSKASLATLGNVNGCIFCARSDNDTGNNPHNPIYGINAAGASGNLVELVGTESSDSGGRSTIPMSMFDPTVRPTKIDNPGDATGLVDTGKLLGLLGNGPDAAAVMAAAEAISARKVEKINEDALVKSLVNCSYIETTDLVRNFGDPSTLDPLADPFLTPIITPAEFGNSKLRKTASVMKLVLNGFAGAGTIEFGGYDYHNGSRITGEIRDEEAGQAIGAALEYAASIGQPLVIYVLSDGSVASDGVIDPDPGALGKSVWRNDNSGGASTVMLVFDPDGRPGLTSTGNQIGNFRANGSVETTSSVVGDNVSLLAEAVVLNYLALHGDAGQLSTVLPGQALGTTPAELDPLIAFQALPRF